MKREEKPSPYHSDRQSREMATLRSLLGVSQSELARWLGMDHSTVNRWDSGTEPANWRKIALMLAHKYAALKANRANSVPDGMTIILKPDDCFSTEYIKQICAETVAAIKRDREENIHDTNRIG